MLRILLIIVVALAVIIGLMTLTRNSDAPAGDVVEETVLENDADIDVTGDTLDETVEPVEEDVDPMVDPAMDDPDALEEGTVVDPALTPGETTEDPEDPEAAGEDPTR